MEGAGNSNPYRPYFTFKMIVNIYCKNTLWEDSKKEWSNWEVGFHLGLRYSFFNNQ